MEFVILSAGEGAFIYFMKIVNNVDIHIVICQIVKIMYTLILQSGGSKSMWFRFACIYLNLGVLHFTVCESF